MTGLHSWFPPPGQTPSSPPAQSPRGFFHPSAQGPCTPPAQTGQALGSPEPHKQWLYKPQQLARIPCCHQSRPHEQGETPGQDAPMWLSLNSLDRVQNSSEEEEASLMASQIPAVVPPCPSSCRYSTMAATPSGDANCDPGQAGAGNSGAQAASKPPPQGGEGCQALQSRSRAACVPKAARTAGKSNFGDSRKPRQVPSLPHYPSQAAPEATAEK